MVRKPEKGTGPKVFYLGAEESVIRPEAAVAAALLQGRARCTCGRSARRCRIPSRPGDPRVDYDVPHGKPWGIDMVLYLLFKAISTGRDAARRRSSGGWASTAR